jgi:hypothetical protein
MEEDGPNTPPDSHSRVPAADDLAGWKAVDLRVATRIAGHFANDRRLQSARAVRRYFGEDDLDHFVQAHEARGVVQSYTDWGVLDYRPHSAAQTRAETMLAEGLPEPEVVLLGAMMQAHPTIYRVAGHDSNLGTVDLEDVLLGGEVVLNDLLLSRNVADIAFIACRIFPAGRFHFLGLAGPPLGAGMGTDAVEFLRSQGLEFTRQGLRQNAHLFGRLWSWIEQWEANWKKPNLRNTDGDELLFHIASFSLADPQGTRAALEKRSDIEYDEAEDRYVWWRDASNNPKLGLETVTLGQIELLDEELVLTVNSARRLAAARRWLETLPGVRFRAVTTRRWDEPAADRPADERMSKPEPVEITLEMAKSIQEMMNKNYMQWLDLPLPVLGGKTPRQACRTPEGRERVTTLIRTMPDPMGPAPVTVPRREMLRELGLDAGG